MRELECVPVVCLDSSAPDALRIFNPNDWERLATRAVIQSCAAELSALHYSAGQLQALASSGQEACRPAFDSLRGAISDPATTLPRVSCFAQVSELHLTIEGFFSSLKSLLDLTVQILPAEGVVSAKLEGFHRKKGVYGGNVLSALEHNVVAGRDEAALAVRRLLLDHKRRWIDVAIRARHDLVHPARGTWQLMYELVVDLRDGALTLREVRPPTVQGRPIQDYAAARLSDARERAQSMVRVMRGVP